MSSSFDPFSWIDAEAAQRAQGGRTRTLVEHGAATPGRLEREGRTLVNLASNDYLGLASDPRVVSAAQEAARQYGWGAGASPLVCGWRRPHRELAEALSEFEQAEAVALFPTGFSANLGTIVALVGQGDVVYADRLNHACLIEGARLSGARLRVYPHGDANRLESILKRDEGWFRRRLIATDGVFSMDGDLAPLAELVELAERFGAMLLVDEAHGTGVFGPDGRGAASACGVDDLVPVRVGTLSKALGSIGGFVAGERRLIEHLIQQAPTLIYSTALPTSAASSALEALKIARQEPWRRDRVHQLGDRLREGLRSAGFQIPPSKGPIVPVVLGTPERALSVSSNLLKAGFLVPAIRPPTVPNGTSRLRISVNASIADAEIEDLLRAIGDGQGRNEVVG